MRTVRIDHHNRVVTCSCGESRECPRKADALDLLELQETFSQRHTCRSSRPKKSHQADRWQQLFTPVHQDLKGIAS